MTRKFVNLAVGVALGVALLALARQALANSANFEFVMERRAVLGGKNNQFHVLEAGALTLNGAIWVVAKDRGGFPSPLPVNILVEMDDSWGTDVCEINITPSKVFNDRRASSKSCGRIERGRYAIKVTKADDDAWHIKGVGTLETR